MIGRLLGGIGSLFDRVTTNIQTSVEEWKKLAKPVEAQARAVDDVERVVKKVGNGKGAFDYAGRTRVTEQANVSAAPAISASEMTAVRASNGGIKA